jgi:hypothetical protein
MHDHVSLHDELLIVNSQLRDEIALLRQAPTTTQMLQIRKKEDHSGAPPPVVDPSDVITINVNEARTSCTLEVDRAFSSSSCSSSSFGASAAITSVTWVAPNDDSSKEAHLEPPSAPLATLTTSSYTTLKDMDMLRNYMEDLEKRSAVTKEVLQHTKHQWMVATISDRESKECLVAAHAEISRLMTLLEVQWSSYFASASNPIVARPPTTTKMAGHDGTNATHCVSSHGATRDWVEDHSSQAYPAPPGRKER